MNGLGYVLVSTHGEKEAGPDPRMTPKGFRQVASLREHFPNEVSAVWAGEARRHDNVAEALGLDNHQNRWWSAVWGAAGSLERRENGEKVLIFADGREVPFERTTSGEDGGPSVKAKIVGLRHNAVVCAGREVLIALGLTLAEAKSGALYRVTTDGTQITEIRLIASSDHIV